MGSFDAGRIEQRLQTEDHVKVSESWAKHAADALFESNKKLGKEADKAVSRLGLYPKHSAEYKMIRDFLAKIARDNFYQISQHLQGNAESKAYARESLRVLEERTADYFKGIGKHFRRFQRDGRDDVLEEVEIVVLSHFVDGMRDVPFEDFIDMIGEDQGPIRMLSELNNVRDIPSLDEAEQIDLELAKDGSVRPAKDSSIVFLKPQNGREMLDPLGTYTTPDGHELIPAHYNTIQLRRLLESTDSDADNGKSKARRQLERTMVGSILGKMGHLDRMQFFATYYEEGGAGVRKAENMIEELVKVGVFSLQDAIRIVKDRTLIRNYGEIIGDNMKEIFATYDTRFKQAADEYAEIQSQLQGVGEYVLQKTHGNTASSSLTIGNLALSRVFDWGVMTVAFNGLVEVSNRWTEAKGVTGKFLAVGKGIAATAVNQNAIVGALGAIAVTDVLAGGAIREGTLYAASDREEERVDTEREKGNLADLFNNHPKLSDFTYAFYDDFYSAAERNEGAGQGFQIFEKDLMALVDDEMMDEMLRAMHLPNNRAGIRKAVDLFNEVTIIFGKKFNIKDENNVAYYLHENGVKLNRNLYIETANMVDAQRFAEDDELN